MTEPIAVTGLGAVSAAGRGAGAFWRALCSGESAIGPFEVFDHRRHRTHVAAAVPGEVPAAEGPYLTRADRFALAAAAEAVAAARRDAPLGPRTGVFFGSSTGGLLESEEFFGDLLHRRERRTLGMGRVAAQQANGPGDAVARRFGVQGPVETVSSACVSGTMAVVHAVEALRSGEVDVAVAGGADSLCRTTFAGFNALRSVDARPCRPFRADRGGLSLGEGAGVVVLEDAGRAHRRGATVLAWIEGVGTSCDAHHMSAPRPAGEGLLAADRAALGETGRGAEGIDFVNAHGTGTRANDHAEWAVMEALFGDRAGSVPITCTKGVVGHLLGAAGALELVATVLCLREGFVHGTPGTAPVDPDTPVALVGPAGRAWPGVRRALTHNLAFGGANAALVVSRGDGR